MTFTQQIAALLFSECMGLDVSPEQVTILRPAFDSDGNIKYLHFKVGKCLCAYTRITKTLCVYPKEIGVNGMEFRLD